MRIKTKQACVHLYSRLKAFIFFNENKLLQILELCYHSNNVRFDIKKFYLFKYKTYLNLEGLVFQILLHGWMCQLHIILRCVMKKMSGKDENKWKIKLMITTNLKGKSGLKHKSSRANSDREKNEKLLLPHKETETMQQYYR